MTLGRPGGPARDLWLGGLLAAGVALVALIAAFFLLYLRVPPGWGPTTGYAPAAAAVFRGLPYPTLALGPEGFRRAALGLLVATGIAYGLAVLLLARERDPEARRRARAIVVAVCVLGHVVLVLLPPVLSTDLYRYALFGRMVAVHHWNPYAHAAGELAADPLAPFAGWLHLRSHYGAAFLWVATAATVLGGGGPIGTALAFKGVAAGFNLAACWAVYRLAREIADDDGLVPLALYAWNPLVLVESAGSGHPDAMMLALALLGAWLWWRGRTMGGMALLTASAAVKYMTGLLALLVAVQTVGAAAPGQRLRVALRLGGIAALTALLLYLPFLGGHPFAAAADVVVRGRALAVGHQAAVADTPVWALVVFAGLLLAALARALRGPRVEVFALAAGLITFFVLFALRWRMPWYFVCGVGLTVAAPPRGLNRGLRPVTLFLAMLALLLYGALVPSS